MSIRSSLLAALFLLLCAPSTAKTKVVATTATLAALCKDVGGNDVEVVALLEPHEDPHTVSVRPAMVAALEQADLVVEVGLGLEAAWLPAAKAQVKNAKIAPGGRRVLDASTLVEVLERPAPGGPPLGNHPAGNPHYLNDAVGAAKVARGVAERIGELDPGAAAKLKERAAFLASKLEEKARISRLELARKVPAERRRVAVLHASFAYLAPALGVEQVLVAEAAPGVALDAAAAAGLAERIKKSGATALVVDDHVPRKQARELAKAAGVRLAVLPGGPRIVLGDSYLTQYERTVSAVYSGVAK